MQPIASRTGLRDLPVFSIEDTVMPYTVAELADFVGGTLAGSGSAIVSRAMPLAAATTDSITFISGDKHPRDAQDCKAAAILVVKGYPALPMPTIEVASPLQALLKVAALFRPPVPKPKPGIHATAIVDPSARIHSTCHIGPLAVVEADVVLEEGVVVHPHAIIRCGCHLHREVEIHPHAVLYPFTIVEERSIIHSGVVLGCDGFGYTPGYPAHIKIPQLGHVEIGRDVEIGANTTIDRATFGATTIGEGTKIDDQVMIGHNCRVGPRNLMAGQVGLAGSSSTGDFVWMAGKAGVGDHKHIGDNAILLAFTAAHKDVPAGERWGGYPGRPGKEFAAEQVALRRLPQLLKDLAQQRRDAERPHRECA